MTDTVTTPALTRRKIASQKLFQFSNKLATKEQVIAATGMTDADSIDKEGWKRNFIIVRARFRLYCQNLLDIDWGRTWESLSDKEIEDLADVAENLLTNNPSLQYKDIRNWYQNFGQFVSVNATTLRHEREILESICTRVLVILKEGVAKYLSYEGPYYSPVLVDGPAEAHKFEITRNFQTTKDYCEEMAIHFTSIKDLFDAREVKVLVGMKDKVKG